VDCISGCTIENAVLQKAFNGVFTIKVHYYSGHRRGPSSPQAEFAVRAVAAADQVKRWAAGRVRRMMPRSAPHHRSTRPNC
jgi:hypothetical protein